MRKVRYRLTRCQKTGSPPSGQNSGVDDRRLGMRARYCSATATEKVSYVRQGGSTSVRCLEGSGCDCNWLALFVQGLNLVVEEAGNAVPVAIVGK